MTISNRWLNLLVILLFGLFINGAHAVGEPAGDVDISFNPSPGANSSVITTALQTDGKLIIGGDFTNVNGTSRNYIARLNTNGSVDNSFNPGTGANSSVLTAALQTNGKIIIGGYFTTVNDTASNYIARLNTDGSLDSSFNSGSGANSHIYIVIVQTDGKIIIGGTFTSINGVPRNYIARLNADGSVDGSFNPGAGADGWIYTATLQADGKVIIGGDFLSVDSTTRYHIARLNVDGSLDSGFNAGTEMNSSVTTTTVQADGKVIIGGGFTSVNGTPRIRIARLNADGSLDSSFNTGTGVNAWVSTTALQADGKLIIGGQFTIIDEVSRNFIARLNADGSLDTSFYTAGMGSTVQTTALQPDGKLIMGGFFSTVNGMARSRIARLHTGDTDSDGIEDGGDQFPNDTDNDGLTNNVDADDDNDGMPDAWELTYGFNPLVNDANNDPDGDEFTNLQEYTNGTNPNVFTKISVKNDYNNDRIAGWIWKGQSNGVETQSQNWQLTFPLLSANFGVPNRFYTPIFPDQANWELVTSGDFNKDGDADMLWRHKTLASWKVWQIQSGLRTAQTTLADFDLAHEWSVIGAGDTDKDGDDDVILNNTATGELMIWEMQDHTIEMTHNIGSNSGQVLARIGDFNNDRTVDLLFRKVGADVLIIWELQANAFVTEHALANTGINYNPVCAGDFDNDGDDDIMLVNSSTLQEKWFVMENFTRTQIVGSTNVGFVFKGCGDYDGDGDADSFWQRSADDANRVVLQQGYGATKQTVYTNAFGGANGFVYRGNSN